LNPANLNINFNQSFITDGGKNYINKVQNDGMRLSDFFNPTVNFILSIGGLIFGIVCLISGIKRKRKSFIWISGLGSFIKNPTLNIIYGIILIIIFILALIWYGSAL